jgi:hypothetical protein
MTEWANYDVDGKRVPVDSERTVFRAKRFRSIPEFLP